MKAAVFSTKSYDRYFLEQANTSFGHELVFLEPRLDEHTAKLAVGYESVSAFVNDRLNREVIASLAAGGTRLIALRQAGINNVDLSAADEYGITVARVPAYSPHGVAEHAMALILSLNRKVYRAHNRVREANLSLEGLLGFEMHGRTVGIIGTGLIGTCLARILSGFGVKLLAYDPKPNPEVKRLGARYVDLEEILRKSDILSLHVPLLPETYHIIDMAAIEKMKSGVMLINTSRGGLVDTPAIIEGLKTGKIGYLGLDVYEEEEGLFFEDLSGNVIQDDVFARLLTFPNVIITGHQAYFTKEAMSNIAETTLANIRDYESGHLPEGNRVTGACVVRGNKPKPSSL